MAGRSKSGDRDDGVTVSFGAKFARSDQFKAVFREGMALVEALKDEIARVERTLNAKQSSKSAAESVFKR